MRIGEVVRKRERIALIPVETDEPLRERELSYVRYQLTAICGESMRTERENERELTGQD